MTYPHGEAAGRAARHSITIAQDFLGDFVATCTCGWSTEYEGHETRLQAQGAADRHIGSTIGR